MSRPRGGRRDALRPRSASPGHAVADAQSSRWSRHWQAACLTEAAMCTSTQVTALWNSDLCRSLAKVRCRPDSCVTSSVVRPRERPTDGRGRLPEVLPEIQAPRPARGTLDGARGDAGSLGGVVESHLINRGGRDLDVDAFHGLGDRGVEPLVAGLAPQDRSGGVRGPKGQAGDAVTVERRDVGFRSQRDLLAQSVARHGGGGSHHSFFCGRGAIKGFARGEARASHRRPNARQGAADLVTEVQRAAIATTAARASVSAYSTSPWPAPAGWRQGCRDMATSRPAPDRREVSRG